MGNIRKFMIPAKFSIDRIREAITIPTPAIAKDAIAIEPISSSIALNDGRRPRIQISGKSSRHWTIPRIAALTAFANTVTLRGRGAISSMRIGPNSRS